jgi:hypothetical protein
MTGMRRKRIKGKLIFYPKSILMDFASKWIHSNNYGSLNSFRYCSFYERARPSKAHHPRATLCAKQINELTSPKPSLLHPSLLSSAL